MQFKSVRATKKNRAKKTTAAAIQHSWSGAFCIWMEGSEISKEKLMRKNTSAAESVGNTRPNSSRSFNWLNVLIPSVRLTGDMFTGIKRQLHRRKSAA